MLLKKSAFLLSCLCSLWLISCGSDESSPTDAGRPDSIASYMPLKVGNQWIYDHISIQGDGDSKVSQDTLSIQGITTIGDTTYYQFISDGELAIVAGEVGEVIVAVVDQQLVQGFVEGVFVNRSILLQEPLTANTSWNDGRTSILSTSQEVSTPAGNFSNVIVVQKSSSDGLDSCTLYYAKDVGIIREEYVVDEKLWCIWELRSFRA